MNTISNKATTFNTNTFFTYVKDKCPDGKGMIEVIIDYCEKSNVDILTAGMAIKRNPEFKELLGTEASTLNMLRK